MSRITCIILDDNSISIYVPPEHIDEFKLMVAKGTNCSPNQSPYIRDFHDRLRKCEHIMGMNMKEEILELSFDRKAILNKETKEVVGLNNQVDVIKTPSNNIAKVIEVTKNEINNKLPTCSGHPETCNCPKHLY